MQELSIKYRIWYNGVPPKPIKLQIPGWSGELNEHKSGDKPMPWHCIPFVEGATYGLEIYYCFDSECHVKNINGNIVFEGDFSEEQKKIPDIPMPPFTTFAPGHFGMSSCLDISVPENYILRTEPHPNFYTDETNTVPCCIPGHLQSEWWSKIFFLVFKNPQPNQTLIFKKNQPIAQLLILPRKTKYKIEKMTAEEIKERNFIDNSIEMHGKKISQNNWYDYKGNNFNDKYKVLSTVYSKKGLNGVVETLKSLEDKTNSIPRKKYKGKLFFKKNESIQDKEK